MHSSPATIRGRELGLHCFAHRNFQDPPTYFADVITKLINLWPASRLDELMPWAWAAERSNTKLAA